MQSPISKICRAPASSLSLFHRPPAKKVSRWKKALSPPPVISVKDRWTASQLVWWTRPTCSSANSRLWGLLIRLNLCKRPLDCFSAGLVDETNVVQWKFAIMGPPDNALNKQYLINKSELGR